MTGTTSILELEAIARSIRGRLVRLSHDTRAAHLGSALSCVDVLVALYWGCLAVDPSDADSPDRDRFILSKGHASAALYATLAKRGFFSEELLTTFAQNGSSLAEQMGPRCAPGIEAATGSLGHGLSLGLGMALAGRIQRRPYRVFVVMSDGECNEGSVWEAAMLAAAQSVKNLIAIVDYNGWQATGRTEEIMGDSPLRGKWAAFGWNVQEVDGHDAGALQTALKNASDSPEKPAAIVARTVKGKGVSFMEDDNNWHYRIPSDDDLQAALSELGQS